MGEIFPDDADVRVLAGEHDRLREPLEREGGVQGGVRPVVGGDPGEFHGDQGLLVGGHKDRVVQRGPRRRGGVRRRAGGAGARVLAGEREVPPGRGGEVGGGLRGGEVEGGGGFGIGGDARDWARAGIGALIGEGGDYVPELEPEN